MARPSARLARPAALAAMAILFGATSACARECTAIGAPSFVTVAAPDSWRVLELCIDDNCSPEPSISVDPQATELSYTVRAVTADESPVVISGSGTPSIVFPNGEDCDGRAVQDTIRIDADGGHRLEGVSPVAVADY